MNEEKLIGLVGAYFDAARAWVESNVLVTGNLVQLLVIVAAILAARLTGNRTAEFLRTRPAAVNGPFIVRGLLRSCANLAVPLTWLAITWVALAVASHVGWSRHLLQITASLTTAWVVIRLASTLIRDPFWSRFIAVVAWSLAALSTLGLFDDTVALLDSLGITFGETRVTMLMVVKGVLSLAILLWVAVAASGVFENRIRRSSTFTPSIQVLFGKLIKVVLIGIAFIIALDTVGVDLTALTVFGGALGVGIGFGLQRIIANLVSGVILLVDKSIKPGDVINLGPTYGWIESLGARYASVRTRDGTEHLIPNEELIVNRVENWSHTDKAVRLKIPIGISYHADVRLAIAQCVEAASSVARVLKSPEPRCLLMGFGDSSVDLQLRIWIDDPPNGRSNVISEVLLQVWDRFHEHGIEIPFPQRDVHLKSPDVVRLEIAGAADGGQAAG